MAIAKNAEKKICHDCRKKITIQDKEIKNGFLLSFKDGDREISVFKCSECFGKNHALTNYQPCEVYSRVVGYLRPVQQWNLGKQQEYEERNEFRIAEATSNINKRPNN